MDVCSHLSHSMGSKTNITGIAKPQWKNDCHYSHAPIKSEKKDLIQVLTMPQISPTSNHHLDPSTYEHCNFSTTFSQNKGKIQAGAEQLTETPGAAGAVASPNNFPFPSTCFHHLITFLHDTPSKTCCINFQLCGWLMCLLIISTKTRPVQRHQNDIIIIVQSSAVGPNVWHRLWLSNHWESLHRHQVIIRSLGPSAPILLKVPSSGFRSKTTRESLFCQVQGQLRNDIWLWHGLGVMEVLWLKNDCDQCLRVFNTKTHMNIPCLLYVSQSSIIRFGELIVELIILSHGNTIPFWVQKPGTLMQKCPRNWTMECQHRLQNSNHYLKFDDLNLQECPVLHFWATTMWGFPKMGNPKPHWFACQKLSITNRW